MADDVNCSESKGAFIATLCIFILIVVVVIVFIIYIATQFDTIKNVFEVAFFNTACVAIMYNMQLLTLCNRTNVQRSRPNAITSTSNLLSRQSFQTILFPPSLHCLVLRSR